MFRIKWLEKLWRAVCVRGVGIMIFSNVIGKSGVSPVMGIRVNAYI